LKRTLFATALVACLAACASAPEEAPHAPLAQPASWKAVLIAGDDEEPAFDNAVDAMAGKLARYGVAGRDITVLKANGDGAQAATKESIVKAFANLDPGAADGCFVFITSHGGRDAGLLMKRAEAILTPSDLDDLLSSPCAARPTVVIASGCFSGIFAEGSAMPAANRVILTAARDDRTSFGCDAKRKYTVFDECLLRSMGRGARWRAVMDKARACVSANEEKLGVPSSGPQMWVGAEVGDLSAF
jgi:Peptidase C13 family